MNRFETRLLEALLAVEKGEATVLRGGSDDYYMFGERHYIINHKGIGRPPEDICRDCYGTDKN